jgi:antitoxin VapB
MTRSTVFKTNRSQAVRLPKAVAFPEGVREVEIIISGKDRIIRPIGLTWGEFFDGPPATEDFMVDRIDPPPEEREPL